MSAVTHADGCVRRRGPWSWLPRDDQELERKLLGAVEEYGNRPTPSLVPELFDLYLYWMSRRAVRHRHSVLAALTKRIECDRGQTCGALLPFVVADEEHSVVSTASLNLAALVPPHDGDPLTGPRRVLDLAYGDTIARVASVVAGVVLLGDARVNPLLDQAWERLDPGQREVVARAYTPFVTTAHVHFLLGRLEHERNRAVSEALAEGLIHLRHGTASTEAFEIERVLPAWRDSRRPVRLLRRLPIDAFGEEIRPHLNRIAIARPDLVAVKMVVAAWTHGANLP